MECYMEIKQPQSAENHQNLIEGGAPLVVSSCITPFFATQV